MVGVRRIGALSLVVGVFAIAGAIQANDAAASAPVRAYEVQTTSTQAGGHPDFMVEVDLVRRNELPSLICGCNSARDITVDTPPGVIAAPRRLPRCTSVEFALKECPSDSQV
jgi:hypothetical protein